jgi:outer membrane protein OmpA-like peptidoglycan-associated protein
LLYFVTLKCKKQYPVDAGIPLMFFQNESEEKPVTNIVKKFYEKTPFPNYNDFENAGDLKVYTKNGKVYVSLSENLLFKSGSIIVDPKGKDALKKLAEVLNKNTDIKILVEGHTDNVGSRESNMTLSKNRANALKKYLNTKGVPDTQMTTKWYGPDKPIDVNTTPEGRQHNRRVEMNIVFE